MREVRIIADGPKIDISVPMGDGPATITGGLGGWQSVERIDDLALTTWEGQEPLTQDVPLLLDGWDRHPQSVERELTTLLKLARDFTSDEREPPPVFKVFGPIFFEGKNWVLPEGGIELGTEDTIRLEDGTLVRQSLVLHLLEFVNSDVIKRRKKGGIGRKPGSAKPLSYDTVEGDTFLKIANKVYGEWERWLEIANKNPQYVHQPFIPLPTGRTLKL